MTYTGSERIQRQVTSYVTFSIHCEQSTLAEIKAQNFLFVSVVTKVWND